MNSQTRDSSLLPLGLPLFVGLVIATLVLSLAHILLAMSHDTAPLAAIAVGSSILLFATLAVHADGEDVFYVQLLGSAVVLVVVSLGFITAVGSEHPKQALFIPLCGIAAGIVGLTLLPRPIPTEAELAERERLPMRSLIGMGSLVAVLVGLVVGGFIRESQGETEVVATATPTAAATAVATGTPAADGRVVTLTAGDNFFQPNELTAAPNENIVIDVMNSGAAVHNLAIVNGPKIDLVGPGQTQTLSFTTPASGDVAFHCEFHPEMVGTIKIQ